MFLFVVLCILSQNAFIYKRNLIVDYIFAAPPNDVFKRFHPLIILCAEFVFLAHYKKARLRR